MSSTRKLFTFIALPLVIIFVVVTVLASRTGGKSDGPSAAESETVESEDSSAAQLKLQNLGGITLAAYNAASGLAGDIKFSKNGLDTARGLETPFFMFGQNLPKNSVDEPQRINPNFEFRNIATQIDIIAAIDGIVVDLKQQPGSNDYEIFLIPNDNSPWVVGYDHVVSPTVKRGEKVKVGQKLGLIAPENSGGYRYELQINNNNDDTMHCPTELLDASVKETISAQITQLAADWVAWYGKDVFGTHTNGCLTPTLTAAKSEGR